MNTIIFSAQADLGINVDGDQQGSLQLVNDIRSFFKGEILELVEPNIIKSRNLSDRRKNEYELNRYNTTLYEKQVELKSNEDNFVITIGGDESVSIPSALADKEVKKDVGLIYFTGACLFDTFETTQNGNLKDLTISAITGYKTKEMHYYHEEPIPTSRAVIIGCRELNKEQKENLRYSGIQYYTAQDLKEQGIEEIMEKAFEIANYKTKGVHIAFSMTFIDPEYAPAVSEPKFDGLDESSVTTINEIITKHIDEVTSYDFVAFNPLRDEERKTEQIAINILAQIINAANYKSKLGKVERKY